MFKVSDTLDPTPATAALPAAETSDWWDKVKVTLCDWTQDKSAPLVGRRSLELVELPHEIQDL
jgi:hypothetical protein